MSAPVIPKRRLWFDRLGPYAVPTSTSKELLDFIPTTSSSPSTRHDRNCPSIAIPSLSPVMALSAASGSLLRVCARQQLSTTSRAAFASCQQQRGVADAAKSSFESPFGPSKESTYKIPDFSKYSSKKSPRSNQVFSYFMAGTMGLASAVGAKATVQGRFWTIWMGSSEEVE